MKGLGVNSFQAFYFHHFVIPDSRVPPMPEGRLGGAGAESI